MFDSFEGIRIYVYDFDHPPPHFHAISAEFEAQISIETLEAAGRNTARKIEENQKVGQTKPSLFVAGI